MNARFLEIEITGSCPYECKHCYGNFPKKGMLEKEKLLEVFKEAERLFDCVSLSGGEPFLHPNLPDLVEAASERFVVFITTSGHPMAKVQLERLKNKAILVFGVDGIGTVHDEYRGSPGAFKNLQRALSLTRDMPKEIIVTLWRGVLPHIDRIVELGKQNRAITHFNTLIPVGRVKENPHIIPTVEELEEVFEKLMKLKRDGSGVITDLYRVTERDRRCGIDLFCKGRFNITPDGDVRPCEFHGAVLGNIYEEPLTDIVRKARETTLIRAREEGFKKQVRLDLKNPFDYHTGICHRIPL